MCKSVLKYRRDLQVAQEQKTIFRAIVKEHEFSKRQLLLDAMAKQNHLYRGFHIEHLQVSKTETLFFNYSAVQYLLQLHMIWTFFTTDKESNKD